MDNESKLEAVCKLVHLGLDYPDCSTDALAFIDKLVSPEVKLAVMVPGDPAPNVEEILLALNGLKIDAIRAHRARTNYGLKESKDAVEASMEPFMNAFKKRYLATIGSYVKPNDN